jgi:hypothetical protein
VTKCSNQNVREAFTEKYSRAGLWEKSWADPPTGQPTRTACLIEKVCGIFVANSANYAGFADSADL